MKGGEGEGQKTWYWWILALIAAVTGGKIAHDKKKAMQKATEEAKESVNETEEK